MILEKKQLSEGMFGERKTIESGGLMSSKKNDLKSSKFGLFKHNPECFSYMRQLKIN